MMSSIATQIRIKTIIKPSATTKFKKEVGFLLNTLMKDYQVEGFDDDYTKCFKTIFKSNLYYLIDNHYELKGENNDKTNKKHTI